jgi:hypothetical protein
MSKGPVEGDSGEVVRRATDWAVERAARVAKTSSAAGACAETGLYPALQRQAERLGFADLLSAGDEPEQLLERVPAVAAPPSPGVTPQMLVRRMRNAR